MIVRQVLIINGTFFFSLASQNQIGRCISWKVCGKRYPVFIRQLFNITWSLFDICNDDMRIFMVGDPAFKLSSSLQKVQITSEN